MATNSNKTMITVILVIVVAVVGFFILTAPDRRTTGERVGDAIDALPQGVDKAARQLEDRTPAEKLGDAASEAGEDVRRAVNQ